MVTVLGGKGFSRRGGLVQTRRVQLRRKVPIVVREGGGSGARE